MTTGLLVQVVVAVEQYGRDKLIGQLLDLHQQVELIPLVLVVLVEMIQKQVILQENLHKVEMVI